MAIVNVKAENENEDVRKISEEINILCSGHRGELSDGYHTFNELYRHRISLFMVLAKLCSMKGYPTYRFEHYSGWFCLGIESPFGQISYHLPTRFWNRCSFAEARQPEFDGHTGDDVVERLQKMFEMLINDEKKTVTLTQEEYGDLMKKSETLDALRAHGVDNWEGYEDAIDDISEGE